MAADALSKKLKEQSTSTESFPFNHIVYTNIGNPQAVGQKPLTWPRQVLALTDCPSLLEHPLATQVFPQDALERAREILQQAGPSLGAYTHSQGAWCFRQDVAHFIQRRDGGVACDPESLYLTNGASQGIVNILTVLLADCPHAGCLIPIPQYPIYSATMDLLKGHKVGYHLREEDNWALDMEELERSYQHAVMEHIDVKAMVLINPGNPTGAVLTRQNLHEVVQFCAKHKIVLLADEVYQVCEAETELEMEKIPIYNLHSIHSLVFSHLQANVYDDHAEFISCKRAAYETGLLAQDALELVSFHSTSKGVFGECGKRGGWMELVGIDPEVRKQIYKLASAGLCSTVSGQIMTSLMARGPEPGDVSYESHQKEMTAIWSSLKRRSKLLSEGLNAIDGFSCQPAQGSMYCFPSVQMPKGAVQAAEEQGVTVDTLYCLSLLKHTGVCVVPASGFGQKAGRHGFRTTFLPSEEEMERVVKLIRDHHEHFYAKYSEYD